MTHDHSALDIIRGNIKNLLLWLVIVWVFVALVEEIIFRGFLLTRLIDLFAIHRFGYALSLSLSSLLFGLSHWYQGKSGVVSTSFIGVLLGIILIWNKFNLWLPILTHGFIDTVGPILIYINADIKLKSQTQKSI